MMQKKYFQHGFIKCHIKCEWNFVNILILNMCNHEQEIIHLASGVKDFEQLFM